MTQRTSGRPILNREVLGGLAIMAVGLVLLSDPAVEINLWASGWTLVLFTVGLVRFLDPSLGDGQCPSRRTGAWLMIVGTWGFISQNKLLGLSFKTSWPLLLTAAGVITVWWAIDESRRTPPVRKAD
jgi:hypothetical protein